MTREEWLQQLADKLRPRFANLGYVVPDFHVSVSWPSTNGFRSKVGAETFAKRHSSDKKCQVFVSPRQTAAPKLTAIMAHEMIHVYDDCANAHKGLFVDIAKDFGLVRPWTDAVVGSDLSKYIKSILAELPKYPSPTFKDYAASTKPQKTYMVLLECECGSKIRTTRKWLDTYSDWKCPCGKDWEVKD